MDGWKLFTRVYFLKQRGRDALPGIHVRVKIIRNKSAERVWELYLSAELLWVHARNSLC